MQNGSSALTRPTVGTAFRRPPRAAPARSTWRFARTAAGLAGPTLAAAVLAGCAGDAQPVDYLHSPTRVETPDSDAAGREYADPVVPTDLGDPAAAPATSCELLPASDVAGVTGVDDVIPTSDDAFLCSYQSAGRSVFRLTLHDYPGAREPADVLDAMVTPYAELEHLPDLGDAAAFVPDSGSGLPPALFVASGEDDGRGVAVLRLAFDEDHEDDPASCKKQLVELAELAAGRL